MDFRENWERRDSIGPAAEEVPERTDFATFVVQVSSQELAENLAEIQDEISDIDCVDPVPRDYFHVTVKLGGFIVDEPEADDELSAEDLEKIASRAREIITGRESFAVDVEKLNLFPNVVFVEVHDHSSRLEHLHDESAQVDELMPSPHDYLPHITLCHFQDQNEFQELVDRLEQARNRSFGTLEVEEVCLVRDDLERYADLREKGTQRYWSASQCRPKSEMSAEAENVIQNVYYRALAIATINRGIGPRAGWSNRPRKPRLMRTHVGAIGAN